MQGPKNEIIAVLRKFNPWWKGEKLDLPPWRRAVFHDLYQWVSDPPAPRAVLLSGARQIGKTTLFLQAVERLIETGIEPSRILYVTFDHPLLKLLGLDGLMDLWQEIEPQKSGAPQYLFLDEIQYAKDWQVWLKHQVDFNKSRRIVVTGSATPLTVESQESGVGRWHTIKLATLSFYEFLQIKKVEITGLPSVRFPALRKWTPADFARVADDARTLASHFSDYLLRGGFPQCALIDSLSMAQKLLREDIVDKVLRRDMTALYGVRRVIELEQTFLYLCLHDGGLLDVSELSKNLNVNRPTATNYIALLENAHLIHRLPPYGYGKEVLRAKFKIYLADPALAPSVMLKGKSLLEDPSAMGIAVETAVFKHVFTRYYRQSIGFSYWRKNDRSEVDLIAELQDKAVPMEIKYRGDINVGDIKGLLDFCMEKKIDYGYVITRDLWDFGIIKHTLKNGSPVDIIKIPAPLACYWLGRCEMEDGETEEE